MIERERFLEAVSRPRRETDIVIHTMSTCNYWPEVSTSPLDFLVAGAMGFASSVGLGVALAQPERDVIVLDGDGSLLMNLGTLVTIAEQAPSNLRHFVLDNGHYELSGRIPTPGAGKRDFAGLARAAGIPHVVSLDSPTELEEGLAEVFAHPGPVFAAVKVAPGKREPLKGDQAMKDAPGAVRALAAQLASA